MADLVTKAVLFDMGNTLVRYDENSPEHIFQKILASLGVSRSLVEIGEALKKTEKKANETNLLTLLGKIECGEYWNRWDSIVLNYLGVANYEAVAKIVHSKWFDFVECSVYPEVREVLLKLGQKKLKTGLISNGYEEEIITILEKTHLEKEVFDIIVGVDTAQKAKPHPEIFEYAMRTLKVEPRETIFIGDRVDIDYKAAEAVGIYPLLIQRENTNLDNPSNLRRISNLEEIFKFIEWTR